MLSKILIILGFVIIVGTVVLPFTDDASAILGATMVIYGLATRKPIDANKNMP